MFKASSRRRRSVVVSLVLTGAAGLAMVGSGVAAGPALAQSTMCGANDTASVEGGTMTVQVNEWDSSATDCLTTDGGADFQVSDADISNPTDGAPGTYNSIYVGCHWGDCTGSDPFPTEVGNLASSVSTSVTTTQPGGSNDYDVAYDIWFNQTPTTSGQPNGEEMMIWLNHNGPVQPAGSEVASNVSIGGQSFNVWYSRNPGPPAWNVVSYSLASGTTSGAFNLGPLVADSESRGYLESSWYLIDIEMGFEIWQGGTGLAVNSFAVSTNSTAPTTTTAPAATIGSGDYEVVNENSGLCEGAAGGSTANGTAVEQLTCASPSTASQEWQFVPVGSGRYEVLNVNGGSGGESWNVTGGTGATGNAVPIQIWSYGGASNEQWEAVSLGNGYYEFIADNSGLCLDTPGDATTVGLQLDQYTCNGTEAQAFRLVPETGTTTTTTAPPPTTTTTAAPTTTTTTTTAPSGINSSDDYQVVNENSGSCVDATGYGTTNGTAVQQWACGSPVQPNQEWQFVNVGSGYYEVLNVNAASEGESWNVTGGTGATASGDKIQLWQYGGATNEQWEASAVGSGYYTFMARNSGLCLDVPGASTANGVQLQQYTCNGTAAQAFRLVVA